MTRFNRTIAFCLAVMLTLFQQETFAQSILDPNDSVYEYDPLHPPSQPFDYFNPIVKWVRTYNIANGAVQKRTQNIGWNSNVYKAYAYNGLAFRLEFPKSYNPTANDGKKYPILIFLHGQGENDSKYLPPSLNYDNHYQLLQGPHEFDVAIQNGTYDGYVLVPQLQNPASGYPTTFYWGIQNDIMNIVKYMIAHNKVDPFHIVVNGLSEGGLGCWDILNSFPTYISSCTPMSSPITFTADSSFIGNKRYTPIWCAQGGVDTHPTPAETKVVADSMLKYGVNFRETIYPSAGHSTWYQFWAEPGFWPFVNQSYSSNPWALFGKTQFWPGQPINTTIGINPGFEAYEWRRNGTLINNATANEIHVTGTGTYDARVKRDGIWSDWSHVPVTVTGNDYRIQAEDWIAMYGVQTEFTTDVDGNLNVGWINNGDYMDYKIAPYKTGIYSLKLRLAAPTTGAKLQIRSQDSTVIATVNVPMTGGWQTWTTVAVDIPLSAGTQNIRIKSITNTGFNINWLEFSMAGQQSSLPVRFEYVGTECKGGVVNVQWRTSGELNADRFSVQRSVDGVNWSEAGSVAASGQSSVQRSYLFSDRAAGATNMYRIVEYDYNGQTTISSIVRGGCGIQSEVRLYPNPSKGSSALSIPLSQSSSVRVQVMDSKGSVVQQKQMMLPAGNNTVSIDMSSYPEGVYSVQVQYNNETKTIKLIKQ